MSEVSVSEASVNKSPNKFTGFIKRFWWAVTVVAVVVIGLIGYWLYENHRNAVYTAYLDGAHEAMSNNNYKLAISDFQNALSYKDTPEIEAQLSNANSLQKLHAVFLAGVSAMGNNKFSDAISDFQQVTSVDKADYSTAQKYIKQAKSEIDYSNNLKAVSKLMKDTQSFNNDLASISSDFGSIATVENNITRNDTFGSQALKNDVDSFSSDTTSTNTDLNSFQNDIGQFNTDAQYVNNNKIGSIADEINTSLNALENDASDMYSLESNNLSGVQSQITNNGGNMYSSTPVINSDNTNQWNADMTNFDDESNYLNNAVSKLKAYDTPSTQSDGM